MGKRNKNRKSFIAIIQVNNKKRVLKASARVYRVMRNVPVFIGNVNLGKQFKKGQMFESNAKRDELIMNFLKYDGHVLAGHECGNQFILTVV